MNEWIPAGPLESQEYFFVGISYFLNLSNNDNIN